MRRHEFTMANNEKEVRNPVDIATAGEWPVCNEFV